MEIVLDTTIRKYIQISSIKHEPLQNKQESTRIEHRYYGDIV